MFIHSGKTSDLETFIRDEVAFPGDISKGKRGNIAKRIQEWLCLNGHDVVVDGDFGMVSESAVKDFQDTAKLPVTGVVDGATHSALVAPLLRALSPEVEENGGFGETVSAVARHHLAMHPREAGGDNLGPWVRLYMSGNEGASWFWCAGFVTFIMKQAAQLLGGDTPLKGSFSCDSLAAQADKAGIFLSERRAGPDTVTPGALFLVRRTPDDWTHVGIVTKAEESVFHTIEGNTNDDGNRNGYEVCARRRGYSKKDFVLL